MEAAALYIKTLAAFMMFSAVVGILAPSSSFGKYLNIITGLMLIAIMLEPLSNLLNNSENMLDTAYFKYDNYLNKQMLSLNTENEMEETSNQIIEEYKKRLEMQTAQYIYNQTGATTEKTEFIVEEDYNNPNFGALYAAHVTVSVNYEEQDRSALNSIAYGAQNAPPKKEDVYKNLELNVKKCLSNFYNIQEGNIHITVL